MQGARWFESFGLRFPGSDPPAHRAGAAFEPEDAEAPPADAYKFKVPFRSGETGVKLGRFPLEVSLISESKAVLKAVPASNPRAAHYVRGALPASFSHEFNLRWASPSTPRLQPARQLRFGKPRATLSPATEASRAPKPPPSCQMSPAPLTRKNPGGRSSFPVTPVGTNRPDLASSTMRRRRLCRPRLNWNTSRPGTTSHRAV